MKQLLQRLDNGRLTLTDVPLPSAGGVRVVVRSRASLISAGTERMLLEFGRAGWLEKARQQPEKVRQVLEKVLTDGLGPTLDAVRSKLDTPIPLGYCNAGVVTEVGDRVVGITVGDRVVTNGPHAEFVSVPQTLVARIPEGVPDEHAAFSPVAAIALQGIRLAEPTLGETVVVYGLGLVGLLAVQLLRANGCRVIGVERDPARLALGERFGALGVAPTESGAADAVLAATGGIGADAVLLTLASDSDGPVSDAARMSRKRGRIVLVGVSGLSLSREEFYRKELSFQVSCSYGPGRYDPAYEEQGRDYPLPFVRWTEQRNLDAVLRLMADGALDPTSLLTDRVPFDRAFDAYERVVGGQGIGVVLTYGQVADVARTIPMPKAASVTRARPVIGVIGAGNYATRTLLPALRALGVRVRTVVSPGGTAAVHAAGAVAAEQASSDVGVVFDDAEVDTLFILTRHDSHAAYVRRALEAGKHVFVEKPLALEMADLDGLERLARAGPALLTVGFNRRFAPLATEARAALRTRRGPLALIATVNAGALPREHWTHDPVSGGGRVLGEGCHFVDLARFFVGAPLVACDAVSARTADGVPVDDIASIHLRYADGSLATLHYVANGARAYPKERLELFSDGRTFAIDNWRRLIRFGQMWRPRLPVRQDKGQAVMLKTWIEAVRTGGPPPIAYDELFETSRAAIRAGHLTRGIAMDVRL